MYVARRGAQEVRGAGVRKDVRVATEDGQSALMRARAIVLALERANPEAEFHMVIVRACRPAERSWSDPDGRGVAEALATALLEHAADMVILGLSCSETTPTGGTTLAAVPRRSDPRDVFISRGGKTLDELPAGSRVGASTSLRCSQVLRMRRDLVPVSVRGPADAHLRKLARGDDCLAAIVVEAARLARKGLLGHAAEAFPPERFPPMRGQGAVAVLTRAGDRAARAAAGRIDDPASRAAWEAERSFTGALGAGPASPVGAFASAGEDGRLSLTGAVYSPDGVEEVRGEAAGPARSAREIGASLADRLLARGTERLMAQAAVPA